MSGGKIMKKIWDLYHKYEEIINYLIVGGLTTVIPKFDSCYLKISRKARKNLVFYLLYN